MRSQLALAAATALLPTTLAMNPEDVTGVISDSVVPNPDLCQALCQKNDKCFYSLYDADCDQCWQMDCSGGQFSYSFGWTKPTNEVIYYCDRKLMPEMPTDCKNLTATATITSADQAQETSGSDKGGEGDGDGDNSAGVRSVSRLVLLATAIVGAAL